MKDTEKIEKLIDNLVDETEEKKEKEIINILKEINKTFLTEYKLNIKINNMDIEIIPIETEIYYYNEKQEVFKDKMIHKDPLQKNNFGKLYIHSKGVDICFSKGNYYLSILLRTAEINGELISGISKIRDTILGIPTIISKLQNKQNIAKHQKRNIKQENIFCQRRIQNKKYKEGEIDELNNIILGTEDNPYKYLDASQLQEGIKNEIKNKRG